MSVSLVGLVGQLGPLRSVNARILMYALAHLAAEDGDCGAVPLRKLAAMVQASTTADVAHQLAYLENELGLIARIVRPQPQPSLLRINVTVLSNPTAHRPAASRQLRGIGGPLASRLLAGPEIETTRRKTLYSGRGLFRNKPIVYVPAGDPITSRLYESPRLTHTGGEGTIHVYRLSPRAWVYSGIYAGILTDHGTSRRAVQLLGGVDILTAEELDHAITMWRRDSQWPQDAPGFAQFLLANAYYLRDDECAEAEPISERIACSILDAHRAWAAQRPDHEPDEH